MKRLLLICGLLWSAVASAQFTPGQLLTAQELNSRFLLYAPLTGATFSGTVIGNSVTQPTTDNSTLFATDNFVNQQIIRSTETVPLTLTGGTYNQATLGSGFSPVVLTSGGVIQSILTIAVPGSGYAAGDLITLAGGNDDATLRITSIGGGGSVTAAQILYGGTGYVNGAQLMGTPIPPGDRNVAFTGTLTSNVTFIIAAGTYNTASRRPSFANNTTGAFTVTVYLSNGADGTVGSGYLLPQGTANSTSVLLQTDGETNVWPADTSAGIGALPLTGGTLTGQLTTNGIFQTGGTTTSVNLTGVSTSGFYATGAGAIYSFYPTIGFNTGDHQRAQEYINFNSAQDATISETGISINATMNTGLGKAWAQSTVYATNAEIDNSGNVYKATTGGTSASSGGGPTGTGGAIADGSVTWAYQCVDQCNAKIPLFVAAVAGSGAGKVWAGDVALTLQSGWAGLFASSYEIDMTNNSGTNCSTCQSLFVSGNAGTNTIGSAVSVYTPSTTNYQWVNAFQVAGTRSSQNSSYNDSASGTYSYQDTGSHTYGVYLSGSYSSGALWANNYLTEQVDFARLNLFPASNTNLNRWRLISNASESSAGSLVLQTTTDGFVSSFLTPWTANTDGSLQITGTTTNNNANAGSVGEYISSAVASGSAVSLTSGAPANVTSISLTAGDWDVFGAVDFNVGATTVVQLFGGSASTTSATNTSGSVFFSPGFAAGVTTTAGGAIPTIRLSLASTTTVYLVAQSNFTVSTMSAYGFIGARRRR